jgi:predicted RNA-binding protein YlqC (UPF0109 family)
MSTDTREEKFQNVVSLIRHVCEELVDEAEALDVTHSLTGTSGVIEICGPSSQIAQIMGSKKKTLNSIHTILFAVSSKYGFRVLLNVLNNEQRAKYLRDEKKDSPPPPLEGPLLVG